jgi:hypothetical protein
VNHKAAINIIAGQLGISREDRQAISREVVGVASLTDMNPAQLAKLRAHFDSVAKRSGVVRQEPKAAASGKAAKPGRPIASRPIPSKEVAPLCRRIRAQLISLGRLPDSYADGIAKQMFQEDAPQFYEWCHAAQLHKITSALGAEQRRKGVAQQ